MNKRRLGKTDLELTTLGVGTWAIGGGNWLFGWGDQATDASIAAMQRALDAGINWIDTAPIYGLGNAEKVVGKFLSGLNPSDRPIIATKFGRYEKEDKTIGGRLNRESVMAECETSLKNLGVDCIDLYQMHWPDPDSDIEEGWQACMDLVQQGKVRYAGVSNQSVSQMSRLEPMGHVQSLQPPLNMLQTEIEQDILPYCGQNQIGVVCYSPMAKGLLTGAFDLERVRGLPENDHRRRDPKFSGTQLEVNLKLVERLQEIANQAGRNLAQLAIAWCLSRPEVTSAIVGVRRPDQIDPLIGAADWQLSTDELDAISAALDERKTAMQRV